MSSVISEIASSTGSKYPCRAKNPATCRVHGSVNPVALITDSAVAKRNLRASELLKKKATSFEDRIEAEMLADKDQLIYDATVVGLRELRDAKTAARRNGADKLTVTDIDVRYEAAQAYRAELLANNPVLAKIDGAYNSIINQPGAKTYTFSETGRVDEDTLRTLNAVPYGNAVVLKLRDGGYVYDRAGDGIIGGYDNLSRFAKLGLKPRGFVSNRRFSDGDRESVSVALVSSEGMENGNHIEAITVLPAGTNPVASSPIAGIDGTAYAGSGSGYRAVLGDDFAYVGDLTPDTFSDQNGRIYNTWNFLNGMSLTTRTSKTTTTANISLV